MQLFSDILMNVTLPIVALVGLGYGAQRKLKLDVPSLNRLIVFVIMPAFLVHFLSAANQPISELWPTIYFTAIQFVALMFMGWYAAKLFRLPPEFAPILSLATVYANVGNYGIPLVKLAYPESFILHQSVITSMMTMLIVSVGAWMLAPQRGDGGVLARLKVPPLALFALGAQLADTGKGELKTGPMSLVLVLKLLLAPALTWVLAIAMGIPKDLTELYVVAAATPVGVLLALFCAEYNRQPHFVSSAVLISTLLSPLVVTAWILVMRLV